MTYIASYDAWRKRGTYNGHKYSFESKDPKVVMAKIKAFEEYVDSGAYDPTKLDGGMTVFEYVQRWYPPRVSDLEPKSEETFGNVVNNHILPHFGNMRINEVKPLNIDEFFLVLKRKSTSLRRKALYILRDIFDSAVENDAITKTPVPKKKKAGGVKAKKKKPLTDAEIMELVAAVKGTRVELFVLLCLCCGLRREETLGLLWSNVYLDVPHPFLTVCNKVTLESNGGSTFSPYLKSEAAYRNIPIPPYLAERLRCRRGEYDSVFVVPSVTTGSEMTQSAFARLWDIVSGYKRKDAAKRDENGKIVKDKNGKTVKEEKWYPGVVNFHVTPHLLRHTYITILCASGMDIKKIQYLAGHERAQLTLDIYTEVRANTPEELAPYTNNIFGGLTTNGDAGLDMKQIAIV